MTHKYVSTLFDAHCHLAPESPIPAAGPALSGRILCGVDPGEWSRLREAAAAWPGTIAAYGVHPWHIGDAGKEWPEKLEDFLLRDPAAWVGEAGLDGLKTGTAGMEGQIAAFSDQLALAARLGRRINIHCVKAWEALTACLDACYVPAGGRDFIVHGFGGPHQCIKPLVDRGAWFTVGPLAWRNGSERARRRAAALPADRVLVESDAFLFPGVDAVDDVVATVEWLAGVWGVGADAAADRVGGNMRRMLSDG